jgi:CysZ protein
VSDQASGVATVPSTAPGFLAGAKSLFVALSFLIKTPATWPYAWVPTVVLSSLLAAAAYSSIYWVFPAISLSLPQASSRVGEVVWAGASGFLTVGVFLIAALLAVSLASPLSGPALEKIVGQREQALAAPPRQPQGMLSEIWCGFRAQIFVLLLVVPPLLALWVLELLVPPAVVVTLPLKLLLTSLALAWNLLDYPLTLRGVRMRERFELFRRHKSACLGFGAVFAGLFWVPCGCQIILLPVGAAAATDLVWQLLRSDPELLPHVERAQLGNS